MKKAYEMNKIASKAVREKIEKMEKNAVETVEKKIFPQIEAEAKKGFYNVKFHVDSSIEKNIVVKILEENGYVVKANGYHLSINWYMTKEIGE